MVRYVSRSPLCFVFDSKVETIVLISYNWYSLDVRETNLTSEFLLYPDSPFCSFHGLESRRLRIRNSKDSVVGPTTGRKRNDLRTFVGVRW